MRKRVYAAVALAMVAAAYRVVLGAEIRRVRRRLGITQERLAERADLHTGDRTNGTERADRHGNTIWWFSLPGAITTIG